MKKFIFLFLISFIFVFLFGLVSAYSCSTIECSSQEGGCIGPVLDQRETLVGTIYCCSGDLQYYPNCGKLGDCGGDWDCGSNQFCESGECFDNPSNSQCFIDGVYIPVNSIKVFTSVYSGLRYKAECLLIGNVPTITRVLAISNFVSCESWDIEGSNGRCQFLCFPSQFDVTDFDNSCTLNFVNKKCCVGKVIGEDELPWTGELPEGSCLSDAECVGYKVSGILYQHCVFEDADGQFIGAEYAFENGIIGNCMRYENEPGPDDGICAWYDFPCMLGKGLSAMAGSFFGALGIPLYIWIILGIIVLLILLKYLGVF